MKNLILLLAVCLASFFLLSYRITEVPPGINGDEAGIGYNAALISKNLIDENGNFLPLFVFAKSSDWKQPVTVYSTAVVFRLFGISYFNLRITSVLLILISIIILYFISLIAFDWNFFLISSLLLVTTPIILIQSHLGLENIAPLPFVLFWLLMLLVYDKSKKSMYLIFAGTGLGIALFSYLGMRLIAPVLVLTTFVYIKKSLKNLGLFLIGLTPFVLLLIFAHFRYPGAIFGNYNGAALTAYDFLYRYLSTFDLSFLFFNGDTTPYHSTGYYGMLLLPSLPLFLYGVYRAFRRPDKFLNMLLISFFASPIFFGFVPDIHRASRLIAILPFYLILAGVGFMKLGNYLKLLFVILIFATFVSFGYDYWFLYPKRVINDFSPSVNVLQDVLKKGIDRNYKYWSSIQFLEETNVQK